VERGTVKSFDVSCGVGMISRAPDSDVRFYSEGVVGHNRSSLTRGDLVWFEVDNVKSLHVAINVRKCI
jgi:cold shock CspA family protein